MSPGGQHRDARAITYTSFSSCEGIGIISRQPGKYCTPTYLLHSSHARLVLVWRIIAGNEVEAAEDLVYDSKAPWYNKRIEWKGRWRVKVAIT